MRRGMWSKARENEGRAWQEGTSPSFDVLKFEHDSKCVWYVLLYLAWFSLYSSLFWGIIARQWSREKKLILTLKLPWSHVRILIYRTWAICRSELSVKCLSVYHNIRLKPLVPFRKITHVICMPHELHIYQLNSYVLFYFWLKKRKVKFHMC